jgi:hypothetical protein
MRSRLFVSQLSILFAILALLLLSGCAGPAPEGEEDASAEEPAADAAEPAATPDVAAAGDEAETMGVDGYDGAAAEPAVPPGMVVVPAGQELQMELLTVVSTKESQPGDKIRGDIKGGFLVGDKKVPAGKWILMGSVLSVTKPEKKGDIPGELEIAFENVRMEDGTKHPVVGYVTAIAEGARKRNIGVIAGAAAAGAILGKAEGGDTKDAVLGAAIGAAAGVGIVRALPGKHLELEKGDEMTVTLVEDALLPYREL